MGDGNKEVSNSDKHRNPPQVSITRRWYLRLCQEFRQMRSLQLKFLTKQDTLGCENVRSKMSFSQQGLDLALEEGEALVTRGHSQNQMRTKKGRSKSRSSRPNKDECAFCQEKRHWKKNCPKLKNKANGKAVMDSNVADCNDPDFSLVTMEPSKSSDVWLMDSACSYHMCPNRDWLVDLQEGECGVIHTADNSPLTAYGVGSIRLKNHDGLRRTLTDVRYVPDLKKNLISVGALESKGFKIIADNGVMRICSGALVVMKTIRKTNNLYRYHRSTIIRTATVTSSVDKEASLDSAENQDCRESC